MERGGKMTDGIILLVQYDADTNIPLLAGFNDDHVAKVVGSLYK